LIDFLHLQVNLYSGALFIQQALHWNIYISILLLLLATAITTVTGEMICGYFSTPASTKPQALNIKHCTKQFKVWLQRRLIKDVEEGDRISPLEGNWQLLK